jgi:hypothetical protein
MSVLCIAGLTGSASLRLPLLFEDEVRDPESFYEGDAGKRRGRVSPANQTSRLGNPTVKLLEFRPKRANFSAADPSLAVGRRSTSTNCKRVLPEWEARRDEFLQGGGQGPR